MPPIEPPATDKSFSMPRWSSRCSCTWTMSETPMIGNSRAYSFPVLGFGEDGPVVPLQPPRMFEHITKYLSVSNPRSGPTILSHQPGFLSRAWNPAACALPERAWGMSLAFDLCLFSVP